MFRRIAFCVALVGISLGQQQRAPGASPTGSSFQIAGMVVDSVNGEPISKTRVAIASLAKRETSTTFITGEDGKFIFTGLAAGKYTLSANHRRYLVRSFNQHENFSSSIAVGPDVDSSNIVFRLPPEGAINGVISDEAGEPVREAQVLLYESSASDGEQRIRLRQRGAANDEGFYHFGQLPAGRYFVAVMARVWYAQRPVRQKEIVGTATIFRGLDPGTYPEEQGRSPLDVAYPITFYPGATDSSEAGPITLKSGERFVADIGLQPVPALHLRLGASEESGESTDRTRFIQLQTKLFDGPPITLFTESRGLESGETDISGVAPGHYQFEIAQNSDSGRVARLAELTASASGEVNLEPQPPVVMTATVQLDSAAVTSADRFLQLYDPKTNQRINEQIPASGKVEFKHAVPPGAYQITLSNSSGEFIKNLSATGAVVRGRTLEIKGSGSVQLTLTVAGGAAQVKGVALRDGKPVAGAMIVLVPPDLLHNQPLARRDQSDSDGTFTLNSVVPGKYTLLALENGWDLEWQKPAVLKPYLPAGEALEVQPNGKYDVKINVQ